MSGEAYGAGMGPEIIREFDVEGIEFLYLAAGNVAATAGDYPMELVSAFLANVSMGTEYWTAQVVDAYGDDIVAGVGAVYDAFMPDISNMQQHITDMHHGAAVELAAQEHVVGEEALEANYDPLGPQFSDPREGSFYKQALDILLVGGSLSNLIQQYDSTMVFAVFDEALLAASIAVGDKIPPTDITEVIAQFENVINMHSDVGMSYSSVDPEIAAAQGFSPSSLPPDVPLPQKDFAVGIKA